MANAERDISADRAAEERSEDDGMPEHPIKARDPARWAADRPERIVQGTGLPSLAAGVCAVTAAVRAAWRRW